ncbi:MAG: 30S ribosomal protein S20 [Campylobacterales bacterium]|nr:30S ribosomal protein S20 [Campylobacterales bacterium]
MANHKSALKRIRQTKVKTERNRYYRTRIKNVVKAVTNATSKDEAQAAFKEANKYLHKMVTKGIMKKQTVSRKVSRLSAFVKKIEA